MIIGLADAMPDFPDEGDPSVRLKRFDAGLDRGLECRVLALPACAGIVEQELLHHDGERYHLLAWCIMPNHVHVVIEQLADLAGTVRRWKTWTARKINEAAEREGRLWYREYFDRYARKPEQLECMIHYVEMNPVAARLVGDSADWPWSSASYPRRAGQAPGAPQG